MKKIIYVIFLIMLISNVYAVPMENIDEQFTKNEMYSKIDLEHKNTRKYVSDELTRQREQFFKEIDNRATYYEMEGKSMLSTTYWKIALVIGGIMFFTIGLNHVLRLKTERVRFSKLQKHISDAIINDIRKELNLVKDNNLVTHEYNVKIDEDTIKKHTQDLVQEQQNFIETKKIKDVFEKKKSKPKQNLDFGNDIVI